MSDGNGTHPKGEPPLRAEVLRQSGVDDVGFRALEMAWMRYCGYHSPTGAGSAEWLLELLAVSRVTTGRVRQALVVLNSVIAELGDFLDADPVIAAAEGGGQALDFLRAVENCALEISAYGPWRPEITRLRRMLREKELKTLCADLAQTETTESRNQILDEIQRVRDSAVEDIDPRFRLVNLRELESQREPFWVIQDLIPEGALAFCYGDPGVGKSHVVLDIAMSIATCTNWHGKAVRPGLVVYGALEGFYGLKLRTRAWRTLYGNQDVESVMFEALDGPFDGLPRKEEPSDFRALAAQLMRHKDMMRLVVIDTLSRAFSGGDENSQSDAAIFIREIDVLRSMLSCAVLVVHHASKGSGALRGSTVFTGAADTVLRVARDDKDDSLIRLSTVKQKDAEELPTRVFRIVQPVSNSRRYACVELVRQEETCGVSGAQRAVLSLLVRRWHAGDGEQSMRQIELALPEIAGRAEEICDELERRGLIRVETNSESFELTASPTPEGTETMELCGA